MVATKNEFVVQDCRGYRAEVSDKSRRRWRVWHETSPRDERNRPGLMKNAGYIGKLVGARSFVRSFTRRQRVAAVRGLISADQPRDKFMCRSRYIRPATRTAAAAKRVSAPKKNARRYSGYAFRRAARAIPPMRASRT